MNRLRDDDENFGLSQIRLADGMGHVHLLELSMELGVFVMKGGGVRIQVFLKDGTINVTGHCASYNSFKLGVEK